MKNFGSRAKICFKYCENRFQIRQNRVFLKLSRMVKNVSSPQEACRDGPCLWGTPCKRISTVGTVERSSLFILRSPPYKCFKNPPLKCASRSASPATKIETSLMCCKKHLFCKKFPPWSVPQAENSRPQKLKHR